MVQQECFYSKRLTSEEQGTGKLSVKTDCLRIGGAHSSDLNPSLPHGGA